MIKVTKYTGEKTYMYPNSAVATPEQVLADYPAILTFPHIIYTDEAEQTIFSIENLAAARSRYEISPELSEEEAISKIEELRNTPSPEPEPTAEERIAAAMEYQNLLSM